MFVGRLRTELDLWSPRPDAAAICGSAAPGRMSPASDIDLVLLHPGPRIASWNGAVESEPVLHDIADHGIPLLGRATAFRQLIGTAAS